MAAFPIQPEQLTNEWLTTTLRSADALGDHNSVTGFGVSFIGEGVGLLGMVIRVALTYADTGPSAGPDSVVIKFAHPVPENRAIAANLNMYEREVKFFHDIAPEVDVPKPVCFFAGMDYETGSDIVVLEDLKRYRAGDQVAGVTTEEAKMVIDAIAPLHARYWGKTDTHLLRDMMRIDGNYVEPFTPSVTFTWQPALANFGYVVPDEVKAGVEAYAAKIPDIMRLMGQRTQTLIHGDVRMDNVMFGDGQPGLHPVVMLDWQAIMVSNPLQDLAWMLSACIPAEQRRATEDELVRYYHQALGNHGVTNYSIEQCFDDYDVALLFMFSYPIIIAGAFDPANERGKALAVESLRRSSQCVADRKLFSRIPA
jgi:hypothetical protein